MSDDQEVFDFSIQLERLVQMVEQLRNIPHNVVGATGEEEVEGEGEGKESKEGVVVVDHNSPPAFPEIEGLKELKGPIHNNKCLFIRPKSRWITPIWYYYSFTLGSWMWTPYNPMRDNPYDPSKREKKLMYMTTDEFPENELQKINTKWIKVPELVVSSGFYKGAQPAKPNIDIIRILHRERVVPRVLSKLSKSIVKCNQYKDVVIICKENEI